MSEARIDQPAVSSAAAVAAGIRRRMPEAAGALLHRLPIWAKVGWAPAIGLVAAVIAWFLIDRPDPPPPPPPADLVVQEHDGRLVVSWGEPNDGESEITAYHVELHLEGTKLDEHEFDADARNAEFVELVNGMTYEVRVFAKGEVDWSEPATALGKPVSVPDAPADLVVQEHDGRLVVSWRAPDDGGSEITAYRVELHLEGTKLDEHELSADARNIEFVELVNGMTYEVRVFAKNEAGWSAYDREFEEPEAEITVPGAPAELREPATEFEQPEAEIIVPEITVPDAPVDLIVEERYGELLVSWREPDDDGGSAIERYLVELHSDEGHLRDEMADSTSETLRGLQSGKEYEVKVFAENEKGKSLAAAEARGMPLYRIAYARSENGEQVGGKQADIYYVDFSPRNFLHKEEILVSVINKDKDEGRPTWSPDGSWIAFDRRNPGDTAWRLYARNISTGEEQELTCKSSGWSADWSTDGREIVYTRSLRSIESEADLDEDLQEKRMNEDGEMELVHLSLGTDGRFENTDALWSIDVSTGQRKKVKAYEGKVDRHPRLSFDNNHIAFVRGRPLGRSIKILHRHSGSTTDGSLTGGDYSSPSWSPVGNQIAFSFRKDDTKHRNIYVRDWTVDDPFADSPRFVIDGDGDPIVPGMHNDDEPSWSPDGRWIAFTRRHVEGENEGLSGIYVVSATPGDAELYGLLLDDEFDYESPTWSSNSDDVSVNPPVGCS